MVDEADKALVERLLAWADSGDYGRGPSKTDLRRIAAARIEAMADEIEALRKGDGYAKAIDDAAKVAEQQLDCWGPSSDADACAEMIAAAIRALAEKDAEA